MGKALRELAERLGLNEDRDQRYAKKYGSRYLQTSSTIDGMLKIDGMLDPVTATMFTEALALKTDELPDNGGSPPQIILTTSLAELTDSLDAIQVPTATLDGQPLPVGVIRMLACDAGIIPAVMKGTSELLDLGRSSRTWTKAQRLAARLRDGDTCTWPGGCTGPPLQLPPLARPQPHLDPQPQPHRHPRMPKNVSRAPAHHTSSG